MKTNENYPASDNPIVFIISILCLVVCGRIGPSIRVDPTTQAIDTHTHTTQTTKENVSLSPSLIIFQTTKIHYSPFFSEITKND